MLLFVKRWCFVYFSTLLTPWISLNWNALDKCFCGIQSKYPTWKCSVSSFKFLNRYRRKKLDTLECINSTSLLPMHYFQKAKLIDWLIIIGMEICARLNIKKNVQTNVKKLGVRAILTSRILLMQKEILQQKCIMMTTCEFV